MGKIKLIGTVILITQGGTLCNVCVEDGNLKTLGKNGKASFKAGIESVAVDDFFFVRLIYSSGRAQIIHDSLISGRGPFRLISFIKRYKLSFRFVFC